MKIKNFQYNHLSNPAGVSGEKPRMSWTLEGGIKQTAYRIEVNSARGESLYTTGIVKSDRMNAILDVEIPSRTKAYIDVTVWDENDIASKKDSIVVITGIAKNEWKAKWINPELETENIDSRRASYLKKNFEILTFPSEAYLYVTCHGLMNIYINGQEISDHQLMPGTEQYNKRLMVETIDVTKFLKTGANEIVVSLGDGWYRGSMGNSQQKNVYGEDIALLAQLELDKKAVIVTDETWQASQNGPIGRNDFMKGEEYDATKEQIIDWHQVKLEEFGYDNLIDVDTVPILAKEKFKGTYIATPNGEKVIDFGQNLVGYVSFEIEAKAGRQVTLSHGETLDGEGNFTTANFQNPRVQMTQDVIYTCKDGANIYRPTKTYFGFRYVKVDADFDISAEDFTAVAIYSDMRQTGFFECGVDEVNKLFSNALWSMKGNFVDVPTDCPTREKSGYSGDGQTFVHTAVYLMDCYSVYAKWIREMAAGQYQDGVVPQVAPKSTKPEEKQKLMGMFSIDGGIGWSDAFEIVPYRLWKRYKDASLIAELYAQLKKWTEYEINRAKVTRPGNMDLLPEQYREYMIDNEFMWGEWLEPGQTDAYLGDVVRNGDPEIGTAFFYMNLCYLKEMAEELGYKEDAARYDALAGKTKEAYRAVFLDNGKVKEEKRQCRFVRPIAHELLNEDENFAAAAKLAQLIEANGDHLNTGFLSTHELCRCLSRNGQAKKAYDLLLQKEMPGWLYAVSKGCTTTPERWDFLDEKGDPRDSFNHYAYGSVVGWLMDSVCGIQVENGKITISPKPDKRLGFANGSYDSPVGKIVSSWEYKEDRVSYHIEVPANTEAEVILENQKAMRLKTGSYDF